VSAISIFHNAEAHFREAIDSVLAQDFSDFELLLVDDGSTDSSTAIAKEYEARDRRVRFLEHPGHANRGMSAARNLGVTEARGEFVAFIDADDRWRSWKLKEQIELLDSLPEVDAVGGAVNYWASHEGGADRVVPTGHATNRPIGPGEATLALYPLGTADAPSMSDLMFRRESIDVAGGFEETFRGAYEDQVFLAKFYLRSTIYFTDAVWSDYRLHARSCMAAVARTGAYRDVRRAFLDWFEVHLSSSPRAGDANIRRALDRARRPYRTSKAPLANAIRAIPYAVPLVRAARKAIKRVRPLVAPGPAILMYHRIAQETFDPWGLAVTPRNFSRQLEWVAQNRTALSLPEFVRLQQRGRLPRDAVALTFDDGYACNKEVAVPLLQQLGVPATIFLPAELVERGREFWWDDLQRIVLSHDGDLLTLDGRHIPIGEPDPGDAHWPAAAPPRTPRQGAYRHLWSLLYERQGEALQRAMDQLRDQARIPPEPRKSHRPLSRDEIIAIRFGVVDFGSHSLSHASLPRLSRDQKRREILESRARCAEITGSEPECFAYPYGDFDAESERFVAQAGFLCACKADGSFVSGKASTFALPRIFVGNWDSDRLARELGRP
jgi:peptidoglycan/xylan/chitin deacetylase (PgdA/CDA1 family)/glycosyltransferase involved in cell wall biosynthesis